MLGLQAEALHLRSNKHLMSKQTTWTSP